MPPFEQVPNVRKGAFGSRLRTFGTCSNGTRSMEETIVVLHGRRHR